MKKKVKSKVKKLTKEELYEIRLLKALAEAWYTDSYYSHTFGLFPRNLIRSDVLANFDMQLECMSHNK